MPATPPLALDEICTLPVAGIAAPTAHLYLWCPNALLPDGLAVMAAWGFTYKANIVWHKVRKDGGSDGRGVGFYFRNVTEIILFGTRGKGARTLAPGRTQVNYLATRKREHSRKPDEQYRLIESCSPGPYLELFGRGVRPGWVTWGDQADNSYEPAWKTYAHNSATEHVKSDARKEGSKASMTKTVRVHETGEPEVMRIEDIEPPSPARGQVHVRNHAIGVNFIDTYFRSGAYPVAFASLHAGQ